MFADLLDQFVCVRLVQCYGLEREMFQFDPSLTMAIFLMNADGSLYGRYGTRAGQDDAEHVHADGLKATMEGALMLHRLARKEGAEFRRKLKRKQQSDSPWGRFEQIPIMRDRVAPAEQNKQKCFHCHWVQGGDILSLRREGKEIADRELWAYPMLDAVGASLDAKQRATVARVTTGTPAEKAGLQVGDEIVEFGGQPIISIADVQWVLHLAGDRDSLELVVDRSGSRKQLQLELSTGWRRNADISWRPIVWMLRDESLGFHMKRLTERESRRHHVPAGRAGYYVNRLAPDWYKEANHAAGRAGLKKGDVLIGIDGRSPPATMSLFLAWIAQETKPGQRIKLEVIREGERRTVVYRLK